MNEALMMKSLWGVATGSDSQWVSLVKARYFLRSFLWLSGDYNCTRFWRSLMQLRSKLAPMVCWDLGELECIVFGEPWYPQALELHPVNSKHSASKGENLYMGKGVKSLGMLMKWRTYWVMRTSTQPPYDLRRQDRLIFNLSTNGEFFVSKAYGKLRGDAPNQDPLVRRIWKHVWGKGDILPRLRLFLWRLIQNGLPLRKILTSRGIRMGMMI